MWQLLVKLVVIKLYARIDIFFLHIYKEIFPPSKTYLEPCETFMMELFSKNSWQLYAVNYLQTKFPSQSPKYATDPLSSLNIFRIIVNFSRTGFFTEHMRWLRLSISLFQSPGVNRNLEKFHESPKFQPNTFSTKFKSC